MTTIYKLLDDIRAGLRLVPEERDFLLGYIETMRQLIADIDASDCLRHTFRCSIFDGSEHCSCERNDLQERINKAQKP